MIGWYTHNQLSYAVLDCVPDIELRHISSFDSARLNDTKHAFYGILRGCSRAMHILAYMGMDYWYIDNGYFDAEYVNKDMRKDMSGKFRVVKSDMIEPYYANFGRMPRSGAVLVIYQ